MTKLQIFENKELKVKIRGEMIEGKPWFVAKDVCDALEIKNARDTLAKLLDDDEKGVALIYTPGGAQQMNIVNEPGLYRLIFSSRKKEAKKIQRWVYHEVLPDIMRTGEYKLNKDEEPEEKYNFELLQDAMKEAYQIGYENGKTETSDSFYSLGYREGYQRGHRDGMRDSIHTKDTAIVHNEGYQEGYKSGYNAAYSQSYKEGFKKGYAIALDK